MDWTAFWNELKNLYEEDSWQVEEEMFREILPLVERDIAPRYELGMPFARGGTAVILMVRDTNLDLTQALKVARPIAGRYPDMTRIVASEISRLQEADHQNIVRLFFHREVAARDCNWPYYIMEYVQDAMDAEKFFATEGRAFSDVLSVLRQWTDAIVFLHSRGTIHCDVKLENILINPEGRALLSDLGSARLLKDDPSLTQVTFTRDFAHPLLRRQITEARVSDSDRARAQVERRSLMKQFDLYALGKNLFRILAGFDPSDTARMTHYERAYLELMAARLLDGFNTDEECALGLPRGCFAEIKYGSIQVVLEDLRKLSGEYVIHDHVPELNHHYPQTVQICGHVMTPFPKRVGRFISLPLMRRLANVTQLGLIVQLYPTATHSRLEHVLGTFANCARYCDALWNDPVNPIFRQIISASDIKALLLAALCHDLGQYPLAHDLEEADRRVFSHHDLTMRIAKGELGGNESIKLRKLIKDDWEVEPEEVVAILDAQPANLEQPIKPRLLHSVLDGPIDADKIDYLRRDSVNLNVPYGAGLDVERLLRCLTVVFKQEGIRTFISLGIHEKGEIPAEHVAFARYAMFGSVYWHHTSRSIKSMLHRAVWESLPKGVDERRREYKQFKGGLEDFLFRTRTKQKQTNLFELQRPPPLPVHAQMSSSDYELLTWIAEHTSKEGRTLLQMLCERRLFKRILVISPRRNRSLWDHLCRIRQAGRWDAMLELQRDLQRRLVEIIDKLPENRRTTTSLLAPDNTDFIVSQAAMGSVLFLLDVPGERRGSSDDLYFLPETRIHGTSVWSSPAGTEDSLDATDRSRPSGRKAESHFGNGSRISPLKRPPGRQSAFQTVQ